MIQHVGPTPVVRWFSRRTLAILSLLAGGLLLVAAVSAPAQEEPPRRNKDAPALDSPRRAAVPGTTAEPAVRSRLPKDATLPLRRGPRGEGAKAATADESRWRVEPVALPVGNTALPGMYFRSPLDKRSPVVILLNGRKGENQSGWMASLPLANPTPHTDKYGFAGYLQENGYAVLTVDMSPPADEGKGPGETEPRRSRDRRQPPMALLEAIEAGKRFLIARNNAGELNIKKLGLIGSDLGATLALYYAQYDWSFGTLGWVDQGKDVKAVVLISPTWNHSGLQINEPLMAMSRALPMLFLVGRNDRKAFQDTERMDRLVRRRMPPPKQMIVYPTSLHGINLLQYQGKVAVDIKTFLDRNLRAPLAGVLWEARIDPLAADAGGGGRTNR